MAVASQIPCAIAPALSMLPPTAFTAAIRAWPSIPMNLGTANAARIPRMTITTTSSMSVKPRCVKRFMDLTPKEGWKGVICLT